MADNMIFTYNDEDKQAYLKENISEQSLPQARSKLAKVSQYESNIKKPVDEWTLQDIEDFLLYINSSNLVSLASYYSTVKDYAMFCSKKSGSTTLSNFSSADAVITTELFHKCVNNRKFEENILLEKTYREILNDESVSPVAKTIFVLLWNGVRYTSVNDIFFIKRNEINLNDMSILDEDGNKVYLDKQEMRVIASFIEEQDMPYEDIRYNCISGFGSDVVYILSKHQGLLFSDIIGVNIGEGQAPERMYKEPFLKHFRNKFYRTELDYAMQRHDIADLKPKGILKSGAYYRAIEHFGITKEDPYKNVSRKKLKIYMKKYAIFQEKELMYILNNS